MIEIRGGRGWQPLAGAPVAVPETGTVEIRGLESGASIDLGPMGLRADPTGGVVVRLVDQSVLRCHVGLLPVVVAGEVLGEVDVRPAKLSNEAFAALRADLERTWLGLIRTDEAPTSLPGRLPDVGPLWHELRPLIEAIKAQPRAELAPAPGYTRVDRVRRPGQLRAAVLLAAVRDRPSVPTEVLVSQPVDADHALVADTLRRMAALARRQSGAEGIAEACRRELSDPLFARRGVFDHVSQGARFDQRYRRVLAIHTALTRAEAVITEGPGDLRVGVKALDRLYEYWVFLKVVEGLARSGGGLAEGAVDRIATRLPGRRVRLELPAGTTVRFADGVEAAFEPTISTNPRWSWQGLELDPHPDLNPAQTFITPDVVVWRPGALPNVVVIDAKYRARHQIDRAAVDVHARYARLRFRGERAVREVVVAHPHPGLAYSYPGYRASPFVPGGGVELPASCLPGSAAQALPTTDPEATGPDFSTGPELGCGAAPVTVIADQFWMHQVLGHRRIDLGDLADLALAGREQRALLIFVPTLPVLDGFAAAATFRGWRVERCDPEREAQLETLGQAVEAATAQGTVVVVSAATDLLDALSWRNASFELIYELDAISDFT